MQKEKSRSGIQGGVCGKKLGLPAFGKAFAERIMGVRHSGRSLREEIWSSGIRGGVCAKKFGLPVFGKVFAERIMAFRRFGWTLQKESRRSDAWGGCDLGCWGIRKVDGTGCRFSVVVLSSDAPQNHGSPRGTLQQLKI